MKIFIILYCINIDLLSFNSSKYVLTIITLMLTKMNRVAYDVMCQCTYERRGDTELNDDERQERVEGCHCPSADVDYRLSRLTLLFIQQ